MEKIREKSEKERKSRIILGKCVCPPLHVSRQTSKQTRQIRIKLAAQTRKETDLQGKTVICILSLALRWGDYMKRDSLDMFVYNKKIHSLILSFNTIEYIRLCCFAVAS